MSYLSGCFERSVDPEEQIVVKVNEETLNLKDFAEQLANQLRGLDALTVKDKSAVDREKRTIIRDFITNSLTKKWAKENNVFVRKEQLEAKIDSIRSIYPDDLAFRRALATQGLKFEDWREKLRVSLLQELVVLELSKNIEDPSKEELLTYYNHHKETYKFPEQVRLSQIVLETEANAKQIVEELKKGKKIDHLAKSFSTTPEGANGGDIGWVERGTLDVFDKAFNMKVGHRSDIIKSPYGYHIYQVTGKRKERKLSFQEVRPKIARLLREKREQALYASWLELQIRTSRVFKDEELIETVSVVTRKE
ncbi:MAG: peptidyl-prolyl cis-trans isomerase [Bdellovibrionales bacterium]|nr:peptidyl-prolyl cis-trans isomerase [Bdellovibrionales bacterium]